MTNFDKLFASFPYIHSEEINLSKPSRFDLKKVLALYNDKETQKFQTKHYYSERSMFDYLEIEQEEEFKAKRKIMWKIESLPERKFIGMRILYADTNSELVEIQGDTLKEYWGKGLTKKAYTLIINYLKACEIKGIYSKIHAENLNAMKLLESLNFIKINEQNDINGVAFFEYQIIL